MPSQIGADWTRPGERGDEDYVRLQHPNWDAATHRAQRQPVIKAPPRLQKSTYYD